jgi:hypothetical protein
MIPEEKIMLPTRAPIGIGAPPWLTPGTSRERFLSLDIFGLRVLFREEYAYPANDLNIYFYGLLLVN